MTKNANRPTYPDFLEQPLTWEIARRGWIPLGDFSVRSTRYLLLGGLFMLPIGLLTMIFTDLAYRPFMHSMHIWTHDMVARHTLFTAVVVLAVWLGSGLFFAARKHRLMFLFYMILPLTYALTSAVRHG